MAKAAALTGQLPSMTSPRSFDQDEVFDPNELEAHPEWVHPEVVGALRIPHGDVTGQPLVEPELPEQPEGGGETLLAMPALVLDVVEPGKAGRESI